MDHLKEAGRKKYHHHMAEFEKFLTSARQQYKSRYDVPGAGLYIDPALNAPWLQAMDRAKVLADRDKNYRLKRELDIIRNHVEAIREKHREYLRQERKGKARNGRYSASPRKDNVSFTEMPLEQRQNLLRELSLSFSEMSEDAEFIILSPEEVKRCRASYGKEYCHFID